MTQAISKRVTYSYLDSKKGTLEGYIDIDLPIDEEITESELSKHVQRKWDRLKYKNGFLDTIQIESVY